MNVNRHTCDFPTVATQNVCGGNKSAESINCLGFVLYIVLMCCISWLFFMQTAAAGTP